MAGALFQAWARRAAHWRLAVAPSAATLAAVALMAPAGLVVAVLAPQYWALAPVAAAVLVALALVDALAAGGFGALSLDAPGAAEVGQPCLLQLTLAGETPGRRPVEAALAVGEALAAGGMVWLALAGGRGEAALTPGRRGTAAIGPVWLRRAGPLGLGQRLACRPLDHALPVLPDLSALRVPALAARLLAAHAGQRQRPRAGAGSQFAALAEFLPGDERRAIDWKASARHAGLIARRYEEERDNALVLAVDCGQAMCAPIEGVARLDRALSAALVCAHGALKAGDRVALMGFAHQVALTTPFAAGAGGFQRLNHAAASLAYTPREPNYTLAFATLATLPVRRALVVVFTDFADATGIELFVEAALRLAGRHRLLVITLADAELAGLAGAAPVDAPALAMAVAAAGLLAARRAAAVRLRAGGVEVIETPWQQADARLIDAWARARATGLAA